MTSRLRKDFYFICVKLGPDYKYSMLAKLVNNLTGKVLRIGYELLSSDDVYRYLHDHAIPYSLLNAFVYFYTDDIGIYYARSDDGLDFIFTKHMHNIMPFIATRVNSLKLGQSVPC